MAKLALIFEIPDEDIEKYIPSVSIDAELYVGGVSGQILFVTDSHNSADYYQGTKAELIVMKEK